MTLRSVIGDLLAPPSCLRCGTVGVLPWCADCDLVVARLRWNGLVELAGVATTGARYRYQDEVAAAIVRGKLGGVHAVWAPLGRRLQLPGDVDVVVPVPTDRRRQRARGFDHTALLAAAAARRHGLPVLAAIGAPADATDRGRRGPGRMPARTWHVRQRLDGARVVIVDDVVTTGTTLVEVARACAAAGAALVHARVVGATPRPERFARTSAPRRVPVA